MRKDKELALKLRYSGKSYSQISRELCIPKSTLSGWLSGLILSTDIQDKINARAYKLSRQGLIKRNKNQTNLAQRRARETRFSSSCIIANVSEKDLFMLGTALYWAEGYKRSIVYKGKERTYHPVSLTNSDPDLIKLYLRFLREYWRVPEEKIKASLRIFPHQNEKQLLQFWHRQTQIPLRNFQKSLLVISKSSLGKRPFNRLSYGVIQIIVADTQLFYKIMGSIDGVKKFV